MVASLKAIGFEPVIFFSAEGHPAVIMTNPNGALAVVADTMPEVSCMIIFGSGAHPGPSVAPTAATKPDIKPAY